MSGHYYSPYVSSRELEFSMDGPYQPQPTDYQGYSALYEAQQASMQYDSRNIYPDASMLYQSSQVYSHAQQLPQQRPSQYQPDQRYQPQPHDWIQPSVPSNYPYQQQDAAAYQPSPVPMEIQQTIPTTVHDTAQAQPRYLMPVKTTSPPRISRSTSFASNASSARSYSQSEAPSREVSPSEGEMAKWGLRNQHGTWSCAFPGCSSRSTFSRGCDLRKHYKRHTKTLFCRHEGCPAATAGGFSSVKDRARHEAKHNPTIVCECDGCGRLFSRQDNMKDHVRRIHKQQAGSTGKSRQ